MKPISKTEDEEPLQKLLREWRVEAPLPPRFQEQVWRRIEREDPGSEPAPGAGLLRRLEALLPRPRFAVACLAVFMAAGMSVGAVAAQLRTQRLDLELSARYVRLIDPYRADSMRP